MTELLDRYYEGDVQDFFSSEKKLKLKNNPYNLRQHICKDTGSNFQFLAYPFTAQFLKIFYKMSSVTT